MPLKKEDMPGIERERFSAEVRSPGAFIAWEEEMAGAARPSLVRVI